MSILRAMEGGDSRHKYSARAAYNFPGFRQGEVLDIDTKNVLCGRQASETQLWILMATYFFSVAASQILMFEPASTDLRKAACVVVGCIGLILPAVLLTLSNRQLLYRILCRSFMYNHFSALPLSMSLLVLLSRVSQAELSLLPLLLESMSVCITYPLGN